jgi:hypothetical protein
MLFVLALMAMTSCVVCGRYSRLIQLRKYCALSNLHDLNGIRAMLSPGSMLIYGAVNVDEVMKGMDVFFLRYHDAYWIYEDFPRDHVVDNLGPNAAEIHLTRYWTDLDTNTIYKTKASEVIGFDDNGYINSVYYTVLPSSPEICDAYPTQRADDLMKAKELLIELGK